MKVVFTGGGTGGHFYPLIAIAEALNKLVDQERIVDAKLYYFSDTPFDDRALFEQGLIFKKIPAGKLHVGEPVKALFGSWKTAWGVFEALAALFSVYPDVVVGKGGYASFPTLFAARILNIPVFIHESDSVPGRTNAWAAKFAKRIAVSFPEAAEHFPKDKVAHTGQPVRSSIQEPLREGANEYLNLDQSMPTILVIGGSQGAARINEAVLDALPTLLQSAQVIHQTGPAHLKDISGRAKATVDEKLLAERYRPFDFLNDLSLRMAAGVSSLVISRAGSAVFEIASWGLPSIIIPIEESHGDHQRENAFNYARSGAAEVIEENNLSPNLLVREVTRLLEDSRTRAVMSQAAKSFYKKDAGKTIAQEVLELALSHE